MQNPKSAKTRTKQQRELQMSTSPNGEAFSLPDSDDHEKEWRQLQRIAKEQRLMDREIVVVMGVGFVGAVMAGVVADSVDPETGESKYFVIGMQRPSFRSYWKIPYLKRGQCPVEAEDPEVEPLIRRCVMEKKTLTATFVYEALSLADIVVVERAWEALTDIVGTETIMPVVYMNSDAVLKAFCGSRGGIVCTSSNAPAAFRWALEHREKVLFFPDQHLGRNSGNQMGIPKSEMIVWQPDKPLGGNTVEDIKRAKLILWDGYCLVHTRFEVAHIEDIRSKYPEAKIVVHPECTEEVVAAADAVGSTNYIVNYVSDAPAGATVVVGTETHLIQRLRECGLSGTIQTAFIERLNLTLRQGIAALSRRTWSKARSNEMLYLHVQWWRSYYHFSREHETLRVRIPGLRRRYRPRTPAMAAGITDHLWSVGDILHLPVMAQGGVC